MIAAVKGLGEVIEEQVIMTSPTFSPEKSFIVVEDVVFHNPTRDEAGLAGVDNTREGANNERVNSRGHEAVISIRDNNRPGVLYYSQTLFRQEVKEATVKVLRGDRSTLADGRGTPEDDGAGDVNQVSINREGNTIRARRGVVRIKNYFFHKFKIKLAEGQIGVFVVVREKGSSRDRRG